MTVNEGGSFFSTGLDDIRGEKGIGAGLPERGTCPLKILRIDNRAQHRCLVRYSTYDRVPQIL